MESNAMCEWGPCYLPATKIILISRRGKVLVTRNACEHHVADMRKMEERHSLNTIDVCEMKRVGG